MQHILLLFLPCGTMDRHEICHCFFCIHSMSLVFCFIPKVFLCSMCVALVSLIKKFNVSGSSVCCGFPNLIDFPTFLFFVHLVYICFIFSFSPSRSNQITSYVYLSLSLGFFQWHKDSIPFDPIPMSDLLLLFFNISL